MTDLIPIPPEPGIRPEFLNGEPADDAFPLGPHAAGRAVWAVSHARFAIREAVRLLDVAPGDEILMPAFCCNTVSRPIAAAGARPILCRVGLDGQPDWDDVAHRARSSRAKALVAVHYLGFPADLTAARRICRDAGLTLIEDCAHALYSAIGDTSVGLTADLATFSLRKTLACVVGGALTVNPARYPLPPPPPPEPAPGTDRANLLDEVQALQTTFDRAARLGELPDEPIDRDRLWVCMRELYGPTDGTHAWPCLTRVMMGHADWQRIAAKRRENYEYLLARLGDWAMLPDLPLGTCPLGFPVLVADRPTMRDRLAADAIGYLLHWSPKLIPDGGLDVCPEVPFLADHVITLPIHQDLAPRHLDHLAKRFIAYGIPPATFGDG